MGDVLVAQAGSHGGHLGRVELAGGKLSATVIEVPADTPPHPAVLAELEAAEAELGAHLDEVLTELPEALDHEGAARWLAEIYRERMGADVGLATPGASFDGGLPAGPLTRGALWEVCHSSGNPGVVAMSGEQLLHVLERGRNPEFARETPRTLRGQPRGILQVGGAETIEPGRDLPRRRLRLGARAVRRHGRGDLGARGALRLPDDRRARRSKNTWPVRWHSAWRLPTIRPG